MFFVLTKIGDTEESSYYHYYGSIIIQNVGYGVQKKQKDPRMFFVVCTLMRFPLINENGSTIGVSLVGELKLSQNFILTRLHKLQKIQRLLP